MLGSSSSFDLSAAKKKAADTNSEQLELAAGNLANKMEDFVQRLADSDMTVIEKTDLMRRIDDTLGMFFSQAATGNVKAPTALGGGTSSTTQSGDEDADLQDQLNRATARENSLKEDKRKLVGAVLATGATLPADSTVPDDVETRVTRAVEAKVASAKASATPADTVDKAKLAALAAEAVKEFNEGDFEVKGIGPMKKSQYVIPEDPAKKLGDTINEMVNLAS